MDLDILAYAMLGFSLLASAVKMGSWILHADPRAIINAGRWAMLALAGLAVALLVWLVTSGRYAYAMMLAAFMLPVLVQAAPRWRVFLGPLNDARSGFPPITPDLSSGGGARHAAPSGMPAADPRLVQQSIAVLRAYVEQSGLQIEQKPAELRSGSAAVRRPGNGRQTMSVEEALDVLGLKPDASAEEVGEAHRRLGQKLDPKLGGTLYLKRKIDEARDVLLGE
ncbi:MAG: hypothetical protein WAM17_00685 [Rhodoplanes sp.]